MVNFCTLFRCRQKFRHSAAAYRHVMEEPYKKGTCFDDHIIKFLAANIVVVLAGVASGNAKRQFVRFQQCHSSFHFLKSTFASAAVVGFGKAFQADGRYKVFHTQHILTECFVNKGTVCERKEFAVGMFFTKGNDVFFTYQRFAASEDVHMGT